MEASDMGARGRRILRVPGRLLAGLFRDGESLRYRVPGGGLPGDATIIDAQYDAFADTILLVVESAEFEAEPEGGEPPEIAVQMKALAAATEPSLN